MFVVVFSTLLKTWREQRNDSNLQKAFKTFFFKIDRTCCSLSSDRALNSPNFPQTSGNCVEMNRDWKDCLAHLPGAVLIERPFTLTLLPHLVRKNPAIQDDQCWQKQQDSEDTTWDCSVPITPGGYQTSKDVQILVVVQPVVAHRLEPASVTHHWICVTTCSHLNRQKCLWDKCANNLLCRRLWMAGLFRQSAEMACTWMMPD